MSTAHSAAAQPSALSTRDFIDRLIGEVRDGQCFVPFLGSGISSASGIIMGMEFTNYLAYVTHRVIEKHPQAQSSGEKTHLDLLNHGWPPLPNQEEVNKAIQWIRTSFNDICSRAGWDINKGDGDSVQWLTRNARHTEHDFAATLAQPPIPQVIRSWKEPPRNEAAERLRRMLERHQSDLDSKNGNDLEDHFLDPGLTQHERIKEKAIRALADWKSTLSFLCRVRVNKKQRLIVGEEQPAIIDAFNQFITRGRHPNLCHQMIAHLSTPMRFHTVLSTNFDDLLETAFKDQGIPLAAMAVTTTGGLPSHHAVAAQGTLVKLHGQFHETRADKSVDEEPTLSDKETFAAYMHRGKGHPNRPTGQPSDDWPTDRLLVIGYSGSDHRCVQMIKHWIETTTSDDSNETLVYWICHNDNDVNKINDLFRSPSLARHICITQCTRPDYLLFEVYQRLCYALPPGTNTYEFPHAIPPYRASRTPCSSGQHGASSDDQRDRVETAVTTAILSCVPGTNTADDSPDVIRVRWFPQYRNAPETDIKTAWLIDAPTMVASAAARAYDEIVRSPSRKVIWLELNDAYDGEAVLRDFIRTLSVRYGKFSAQHVALHPRSIGPLNEANLDNAHAAITRYVTDLLADYRASAQSIVLMLYGRDGYGRHAAILPAKWPKATNQKNTVFGPFSQLHAVIEGIAGAGVTTIYFPLTQHRAAARDAYIKASINKYRCSKRDHNTRNEIDSINDWTPDDFANDILKKITETPQENIQKKAEYLSQVSDVADHLLRKYMRYGEGDRQQSWTPEDLNTEEFEQIQWLYGMTLIRHSRHPSVLFSGALFPPPHEHNLKGIDNDFYRSQKVKQWLDQLGREDVLFVKPGGAIWTHHDLTSILNRVTSQFTLPDARTVSLHSRRSKIHYGIGEWYQKAFFSSGHVIPLIEAVHHFIQSALTAHSFCIKNNTKPNIALRVRRRLIINGFNQATKTLLVGWDAMKYWLASGHEISWLAEGTRDAVVGESRKCLRSLFCLGNDFEACDAACLEFVSTLESLSRTLSATGSGWVAETGIVVHSPRSLGGTAAYGRRNDNTFPQLFAKYKELHNWSALGGNDKQLNTSINDLLNLVHHADAHNYVIATDPTQDAVQSWGALTDSVSRRDQWLPFLHVLGETAFLMLRRAKVKWHADQPPPSNDWITVSRYCERGLDGCKYLPPGLFRDELQFKAMFHQICSVALANLGRFHEARRHLTDSQSSLARSSLKTRTDQAIASIRHAEVAITEAFWIKSALKNGHARWKKLLASSNSTLHLGSTKAAILQPKQWDDQLRASYYAPPFFSERIHALHRASRHEDIVAFTRRHYAVLLDEGVLQLTKAEHLLQGASHSSHWWFQLHLLYLRVYGLLKPLGADASRCLIYRHHTLEEGIRRHFLAAVRIADGEPFRLLRCVKYYRKAVEGYQTIHAGRGDFGSLFDSIAGNDSEGQPAARKAVFLGARNTAYEVINTESQGYDFKPNTWPEMLHDENYLAKAYNKEIELMEKSVKR